MPPTLGHGKICYLLIPAEDVEASAAFYRTVFGWSIRQRSDGGVAFDDGVGEVSGSFVRDRPPLAAGFLHIMVADAERTCALVTKKGGEVVEAPNAAAREITALFRDPAGNLLSIYQERSLGGESASMPRPLPRTGKLS